MSNGMVIDDKTKLSMMVYIGFADRSDFIRFPIVPVTEEQPKIKWSFSLQAQIPFTSVIQLPDTSTYLKSPLKNPLKSPLKNNLNTSLPDPGDTTGDGGIVRPPLTQYAIVNLKVNVIRETDGLVFTIERSGTGVPDWENVFVTMLAMKEDNSAGYPVFHDVLGQPTEPPRIARVPLTPFIDKPRDEADPSAIPFQDFTSSIADSIKKAQEQIQSKLGGEMFGLDLENFEIKTPYVVNINANNELIMTKPPTEPVGNFEPAFSKLTFRKTIKLE